MRSCPKFATLAACVGLFAASPFLLANREEKPKEVTEKKEKKTKGEGKKKDGKKGAANPQEKGKMAVPILKGHDTFGLKIPYYNTEGKLQMVFNIGKASRLDENRVGMEEMQLETYDDAEKPEMTIELPQSVLDLNSRVITTDTSVTIKRSDFEITGKKMIFNTQTKQGKLSGNVRMLIYDLEGVDGVSSGKEEKNTP